MVELLLSIIIMTEKCWQSLFTSISFKDLSAPLKKMEDTGYNHKQKSKWHWKYSIGIQAYINFCKESYESYKLQVPWSEYN